jgi:hypothetical protein
MYEYRLCQIIQESFGESFYKIKDKSCSAIKKQKTKLFVSKPFKKRTKGKRYSRIAMTLDYFDLYVWNKIRLKLFREVEDVKKNQEFKRCYYTQLEQLIVCLELIPCIKMKVNFRKDLEIQSCPLLICNKIKFYDINWISLQYFWLSTQLEQKHL